VAAASKAIKINGTPYTLIALPIRGGGYESEWADNFTVGTDADHEGFAESAIQVVDFLTDYINEKHIAGNVAVWLTGYSRAAAVANIASARLDEAGTYKVVAYTFETPLCAQSASGTDMEIYSNIFNIVNPNDLVSKVAPAAWGFSRYGVDKMLPVNDNSDFGDMWTQFQRMDPVAAVTYLFGKFQLKELDWKVDKDGNKYPAIVDAASNMSQGDFLDIIIKELATQYIGSRGSYVDEYQEPVRDLAGLAYMDEDKRRAFALTASNGILSLLKDNSGHIADLGPRIEASLEQSLKTAGVMVDTAKATGNLSKISGILASFANDHPEQAVTFLANLPVILSEHSSDVCMAWLRSEDPNYK
jgi:hypothetical protein